jgi:hypothetical protein
MQRGSTPPIRFAEKGGYAAAAARPDGRPIVVWEGERDGAKTILSAIVE